MSITNYKYWLVLALAFSIVGILTDSHYTVDIGILCLGFCSIHLRLSDEDLDND